MSNLPSAIAVDSLGQHQDMRPLRIGHGRHGRPQAAKILSDAARAAPS